MDQQALHTLLGGGIKHGASDIHFRPGSPPLLRIDGKMLTLKYDRIMPADTLGMAKLFVGAAMPHEDIPDIQEFIKDMERTGRLKDAIEKGRKQYGMQSFDQHLSEMYQNKIITLDTARQASTNPNDFERALHFE